jgi:hypothetical protein
MRELVLTDDPVLVNFIETLLKDAGIVAHVFDRHSNALLGAVGRAPQRIVVEDDDWPRAVEVLKQAGLENWIVERG